MRGYELQLSEDLDEPIAESDHPMRGYETLFSLVVMALLWQSDHPMRGYEALRVASVSQAANRQITP